MFFLLLRLSPWLLAGLAALVSWWQWHTPSVYPWPLFLVLIGYVVSAGGLAWRSRHWREGLFALWPTCVAIISLGFGHLLVEDVGLRFFTTVLFAFIPWLALRLGWLLLYESSHYPPQAFFRFHLALVPVCLWYVFYTLQGIQVFLLPATGVVAIGALIALVCLLAGTIRSWSDPRERRWFWTSVLLGAHAIILLMMLPTSMAVIGALAALLVAIPLRLRQLAHEREGLPPRLWIEALLYVAVWVGICITAPWG